MTTPENMHGIVRALRCAPTLRRRYQERCDALAPVIGPDGTVIPQELLDFPSRPLSELPDIVNDTRRIFAVQTYFQWFMRREATYSVMTSDEAEESVKALVVRGNVRIVCDTIAILLKDCLLSDCAGETS